VGIYGKLFPKVVVRIWGNDKYFPVFLLQSE
jgi:hypothetical protein